MSVATDDKNGGSASPPRRRSGTRRRVSGGDLAALRRELWFAIRRVGDILDDPDATPSDVIRAANALAAVGNSYRGIVEATDFEARMVEIEQWRREMGE